MPSRWSLGRGVRGLRPAANTREPQQNYHRPAAGNATANGEQAEANKAHPRPRTNTAKGREDRLFAHALPSQGRGKGAVCAGRGERGCARGQHASYQSANLEAFLHPGLSDDTIGRKIGRRPVFSQSKSARVDPAADRLAHGMSPVECLRKCPSTPGERGCIERGQGSRHEGNTAENRHAVLRT